MIISFTKKYYSDLSCPVKKRITPLNHTRRIISVLLQIDYMYLLT